MTDHSAASTIPAGSEWRIMPNSTSMRRRRPKLRALVGNADQIVRGEAGAAVTAWMSVIGTRAS
jgi:hypothetical protein